MKLRVLCNFHAFQMLGHANEVIVIDNERQAIDLINLGWVEQIHRASSDKQEE